MGERYSAEELIETIVAIDSAETEQQIVALFSASIARYGFTSVALGYLINPLLPPAGGNFQVTTWPIEWYERWRTSDFIVHDPIAHYALKTRRAFTWRTAYEHGSKFGKCILDESRQFGFLDGLAIPIHSPDGPPGCVSLGGDLVDLSPKEQASVELVSVHVYSRLETLAGPRPMRPLHDLTRRETDVLQYAAAGKTNWEIGKILSLSENTVREYVTSAMRKLDCVNRAHTVAVAIQHALILP